MSSQTNKELWKRWIEVWNGNLSIADEIIAPTFVAHFAPASTSGTRPRWAEAVDRRECGSLHRLQLYDHGWSSCR